MQSLACLGLLTVKRQIFNVRYLDIAHQTVNIGMFSAPTHLRTRAPLQGLRGFAAEHDIQCTARIIQLHQRRMPGPQRITILDRRQNRLMPR